MFGQDIRRRSGVDHDGFREPSVLVVLTVLVVCAPVVSGGAVPLPALRRLVVGVLVHILIGWPEGALPLAVLFLTYTVAAWCRRARRSSGWRSSRR